MPSTKIAISSNDAPAAIVPYTQAVRVGDLLFTSGQVALDPATGAIVAGGIADQTTRVLENLKAVLTAAGSEFSVKRSAVCSLKKVCRRTATSHSQETRV